MRASCIRRGVLAVSALLWGCVGGPGQYLKNDFQPPKLIAVLPLNNHTVDLDGPVAVQYWMDQRLQEKKGYTTLSLPEVEDRLRSIGITDGGQLPSVTAQKLGEALKVDAVVYGELLEFAYQTTGFLNVRKVRARFRMVDTRSGETLWENEGLGANSEAAATPAQAARAAVKQLSTAWAEKAANNPLRTEIWDMIWNAIEYLPPAR